MRYVIGIDAGGSKTLGLLADEEGNLLAEARGGGANLQVHGESGVEEAFADVLQQLAPPGEVAAVCVGVAGAERAEEQYVVRTVLERLGLAAAKLEIAHDAAIALVAGAEERFGIVVVSGTGSIAYGVDPSGRTARAGGWGFLLGDEGSAFWLGHGTLRRAVRSFDGRGPKTVLTEKLARHLKLDLPAGLVAWAYGKQALRSEIAALAPLVQEAVDEGDPEAMMMVGEAARHLSAAAQVAAGQLDLPESFPVVLTGGTFRGCPALLAQLTRRLELQLPGARVRRLEVEPAQGAVRMALELLA